MDDKNLSPEQTLTNVQGVSATAVATLDRAQLCENVATVRDFFNSYAQFVWRTARYLGVSESDLDDVSQEVFTVIHRRIGDFEARSTPRTWIYGICLRVVSAYRRRAFRRHEQLYEQTPEQVYRDTPETTYKQQQARELLQFALNQIDAEKRAVFVLYELEQLNMEEVAAIVGCRRKTAYSRLYAARKDVLRILKESSKAEWGSDD
jgi:RNA polymerase sigma-70 factor, ECF subfamily